MKRIAFLISGGDAPGIRACLFGIAASARSRGLECLAVPYGLDGLIDGRFESGFVPSADTIGNGGSPFPGARSERFLEERWRAGAVQQMEAEEIDSLVILGGDGSAQAARALEEQGVPCILVPVTVDNDLWGTDCSLGFDSGVQYVCHAVAAVQETARAVRGRVFLVETLGANAGHLALAGGLAGGSDLILLPEFSPQPLAVANRVKAMFESGREWVVITAGEGALGTWQSGGQGVAFTYGEEIRRLTGVRSRVSILGYAMRGAPPSAFDILLGQLMGAKAVELLQQGQHGRMVAFCDNRISSIRLRELDGKRRELHPQQVQLADLLGCLVR